MKIRKVVSAVIIAAALVSGAAGCSAPRDGHHAPAKAKDGQVAPYEDLTGWYPYEEDKEVYCIYQLEGYSGGITCDWEHPRAAE